MAPVDVLFAIYLRWKVVGFYWVFRTLKVVLKGVHFKLFENLVAVWVKGFLLVWRSEMVVSIFVEILQIEFEKLILEKFKAYRAVSFIFL